MSTGADVKEDDYGFIPLSDNESDADSNAFEHSVRRQISPLGDELKQDLKAELEDSSTYDDDVVEELCGSSPPSILRRSTSMVNCEDSARIPLHRSSSMPLINKQGIPRTSSKVSFQSVKIREYKIALVENPGCTVGPPIGLGECYVEKEEVDLHTYETERGPRRGRRQLHVNRWQRKNILRSTTDHTDEEIKQVTKDVRRTRNERSFSTAFWPILDVKEALSRTGKKVVRKMKKKKDVDPLMNYSSHL